MEYEKIGKFIKSLRLENNMTQQELSEKLVTSREFVSKMERGVNKPTIEILLKLSNIFDIGINELLSGKKKNEKNQKEIDNASLRLVKENDEKIKRIIFGFILFHILFIIFIFYFFYMSCSCFNKNYLNIWDRFSPIEKD